MKLIITTRFVKLKANRSGKRVTFTVSLLRSSIKSHLCNSAWRQKMHVSNFYIYISIIGCQALGSWVSEKHMQHNLNENRAWDRSGRDGSFQSCRTTGRHQNWAKPCLVCTCDKNSCCLRPLAARSNSECLGTIRWRGDAIHERIAERAWSSGGKILKTMAKTFLGNRLEVLLTWYGHLISLGSYGRHNHQDQNHEAASIWLSRHGILRDRNPFIYWG